jgi:hypothetical protein
MTFETSKTKLKSLAELLAAFSGISIRTLFHNKRLCCRQKELQKKVH